MPGISFLITVYNKAPYLGEVVAGLAGQRGGFEREFVFVDDGSTDGSFELVRQLTAGWPNVILIRQKNMGPSAAMNAAARAASQPYLKFVDADDILVPDSSVWLLDALHRHQAVCAFGHGGSYDLGQPVVMPETESMPGSTAIDDPMTLLLERSFVSPSYMMVPTAEYMAVGGCVENIIPQDYSLQLKLARRGCFAQVSGPIALMPRVAPGRLSDAPARTLHDINYLLLETLRDVPGLTTRQRRLAARRASGRALRFRLRYPVPSPLWQSVARYLQARLPLPFDETGLIAAGLKDFGVPSQADGFHPYPNCLRQETGL